MSSNYTRPQLEQMANNYALQYGVDPDFYHSLITQESGFNPHAKSSVGALGIAQFMPSTAKGMGFNPLDPRAALENGAKYLSSHLDQLNGSYELAAASYNAGLGAVQKYGGIPPYKQTQNYVKNIMAMTNARKAQQGGQTSQQIASNPIAPQQLSSGQQSVFPEELGDDGGEAPGKKTSFQPISAEELFPTQKVTSSPDPQQSGQYSPPTTDFEHLPDYLNANYPGGLKAFMASPVNQRRPVVDQYNHDYLAKNAFFQTYSPQEKLNYVKDQNNYMLQAQPFDLMGELKGLTTGIGQSIVGQANAPQGIGEQIGQFVGPLAGTLGAGLAGGALGSVVPGIGTTVGALGGLVSYGMTHGTMQGLHTKPDDIAGALGHGALEAGANALAPILGPNASLLERAGINLGIGGISGGAESALSQYQNSQNIDLGKTAIDAGEGGLSQVILGEALHQAPRMLGKATDLMGRLIPTKEVKQPPSGGIQQQINPDIIPGTPEYQARVQQSATNPMQLDVYKKVVNNYKTQLARRVAVDADAINEDKSDSIQFAHDVVAHAEGLATPKDTGKVTYRPLSEDDIDNHVTGLLDDWQNNNAGDLAANLSEIRKGAKTDFSYREVLNRFSQEKARIQAEGKGQAPSRTLVDNDGNVYRSDNGELTSVSPDEGTPTRFGDKGDKPLLDNEEITPQPLQGEVSQTSMARISKQTPLFDNALPQEQGVHTTLSRLLESPQVLTSFQGLPIETQQNILAADQAMRNGKRVTILNYAPKTGMMSSGDEGIFTLPEPDKYVTPLGFEMGSDGTIRMRGYNNNLMEREYIFSQSDNSPGIKGLLPDPRQQGVIGRLANAYHPKGMYLPSDGIIDKAVQGLKPEQLQALKQPVNTMAHNAARTQLNALFTDNPDMGNHAYAVLTDNKALTDHIQERLAPTIQQALNTGSWDITDRARLEKAIRQDPTLSRLTELLGC